MTSPRVSCIVPVFNGELFIRETLESIFRQTYSHLEVIVVDDGSTDQTARVVQSFGNGVHYFYQPNQGPSAARNLGISRASGEFVAFLDADDLWHPEKIALQLEHFRNSPDLALSFTLVRNFWDPGSLSDEECLKERGRVKLVPPYVPSSFMLPRSIFEKTGKFDEKLVMAEDTELFLRMSHEYNLRYDVLDQVLVSRRLHKNNLTRGLSIVRKDSVLRWAENSLLRHKREAAKPEAGDIEKLEEAFARAEKNGNPSDYYVALPEHTLRLRFANPVLIPLVTPAFEHLKVERPQAKPRITIYLWDCASTGSELPPPPPKTRGFLSCFEKKAGILNVLHSPTRQGFYCVRDVQGLPQSESGAPLSKILNWWMRDNGFKLVHAGAVGILRGGAVLLVGKGNSGKSTSALACLAGGMRYLSDDYCFVTTAPPFHVQSLYCSGKIHRADAVKFPGFAPCKSTLEHPGAEKTLFFFHPWAAEQISKRLSLRAIFVPMIHDGAETTLLPASASVALKALAPSTLFQMPDRRPEDFYDLVDLAKNLPCFILKVGTRIDGIAPVINGFLESSTADTIFASSP